MTFFGRTAQDAANNGDDARDADHCGAASETRLVGRLRAGAALKASAAVAALVAAGVVAGPARAQIDSDRALEAAGVTDAELADAASLEADNISYDQETGIVRASGDVEVFYAGRVLRADAIVYDARADRISAQGDITVINPDGSVIVADEAEFDSEIRNGLIKGARAVMADGQGRMAAVEGRRIDGEITTLSKAVYSPCHVCADDPTPLWRIRARRIVHDEVSREITYEDATFEIAGVPVAWLPVFSHADPTVRRRSGFLTPSLSSSDELGVGVASSYYWAIAPNRDLTATAFVFSDENPVVAGEYRAIETYGAFEIAGSATWSDDELESGFRGHFIGDGEFGLGGDLVAGFDALVASDDTYLRRYDFSNADRAQTRVYVEQFGETGYASIEGVRYQSFREDERAGELPQVLPHFDGEQRFDDPLLGGAFVIGGDALWLQRTDGRDVGRLSVEAAWERGYVTSGGVVFDARASVRGDYYSVQDDDTIDEGQSGRVLPLAALTTSYPLGRVTDTATHVIEPIGVLVVAPYGGDDPTEFANEDSQDFELDVQSIFAVERITGLDRWEEGPRATIGARYIRDGFGDGLDVEVAVGQSFRLRETDVFSDASGLSDEVSDFVGSWRISDDSFVVAHRFRVTDQGDLARNEVYASLQPFERLRLDGSFVHLDADPAIDADVARTEGLLDAELDLTSYWTVSGSVRRDFEEDRFVSAGGGLRYLDECLEVSFTVARRFNSVDDAPASTNVDLTIRLIGIDG